MSGIKGQDQESSKGTSSWTIFGVTLLSMIVGGALIYGLMGGPIPTHTPDSWNTSGTSSYIVDSLLVNGTYSYRSFNCSSQTTAEVSTNASAVLNNVIGNTTTGGRIVVKDGLYMINGSIIDAGYDSVSLMGEGNSTVFKLADNSPTDIISLYNVNGWCISDLQLDGNKANNNGSICNIRMRTCSYAVIERIWSHDTGGTMMAVFSTGGQFNRFDKIITENDAHDGIHIEDTFSLVSNCIAMNEGNEGIDFSGGVGVVGGSHNSMINCKAINCVKGLRIYTDSHYNIIQGCEAVNCSIVGLGIGTGGYVGCNYSIVSNCQFFNNTYGIWVYAGSNCTKIIGCQLNSIGRDIAIEDDDHEGVIYTTIQGNSFYGNAQQVWVGDATDIYTSIVDNLFLARSTSVYCIETNAPYTVVKSNTIVGTKGANFDSGTADYGDVVGNTINCTAGLRLYDEVNYTWVDGNNFQGCGTDVTVWQPENQLWGCNINQTASIVTGGEP